MDVSAGTLNGFSGTLNGFSGTFNGFCAGTLNGFCAGTLNGFCAGTLNGRNLFFIRKQIEPKLKTQWQVCATPPLAVVAASSCPHEPFPLTLRCVNDFQYSHVSLIFSIIYTYSQYISILDAYTENRMETGENI